MNSSLLRHSIQIQQSGYTDPSAVSREVVTEWGTLCIRRAAIHAMSGKEQAASSTATYKITVRYMDDLVGVEPSGFRIVWKGRIYAVNAILEGDLSTEGNDTRGKWLTLLCTQFYDPQDPAAIGSICG